MTEMKEVENEIRDLINWINVWNLEEIEGGVKKIEDETVEKLISKLQDIAQKAGSVE